MGQSNGNGDGRQDPDRNFPLVLVVDDETQDLEFTVDLLKRNGFRVVGAASYDEAIRELGHYTFAAAVVDYWLTDRMKETGEDLLRHIRDNFPGCARVLFSADDIGYDAAERTGSAFFDKSNTPHGLVALLRAAVNRAGMI